MMDIFFSDHSLIQQPQKRLSLGSKKWLRLATFVCMDIIYTLFDGVRLFARRTFTTPKIRTFTTPKFGKDKVVMEHIK